MPTTRDPLLDELRDLYHRFADRFGDELDPKETAERFSYAAHLIALDTTDKGE